MFESTPPYDARAVANTLLDIALRHGLTFDLLKLETLVYISHGWYLCLIGSSLISDPIEAWKHGPMIRSIYDEWRRFGRGSVAAWHLTLNHRTRLLEIPVTKASDRLFLESVWVRYDELTGAELAALVIQPGTPWHDVRRTTSECVVIPNDAIRTYYDSLAIAAR